jgi:SAM-dependent methyltransferase
LDVGCGTGRLVLRIAPELTNVTGIERDQSTAAIAAAATAGHPDVEIIAGSLPDEVDAQFDLVSVVAVLHHLPLVDGVGWARDAVAEGGRLIIVGAYRETSDDRPLSLVSLALNPLIGFIKHPRRADRFPSQMTASTANPIATFCEIKDVMTRELPGVRVSRRLFRRYVATWTAPAAK